MDVDDDNNGGDPGPFRPKFLVTTWTQGGLNLRAYFTEHGDPQWLFERVHQHLKAKCEGGAYLRKNLEGLQETLREFGVPPGDLSYKGVGHQHTEMEPWSDHTLTSRALLTFLFYQVKHRRLSCDDKAAAMSFLNKLVASIIESAGTRPPPVGLCVLDGEGVLHRVEVSFTTQGVTNDWCNLAGLSPAAKDLWSKLQDQPWCSLRITSSFDSSTLQDVLFFLCYLVAHPKEVLSKCNLFEDVCKPVLPDLLLWLGKIMDDNAKHLATQPLQDLPLLMTKGGRHKRKADQVNKFILLDKLKQHKNCRKRVASTHTSLTAKHSDLVEREAHMTVVLYNEKVAKAFANGPRQFSTSWDPSTYGGKNTLVSTLYSPATDTVAYMPNQQLRRMLMSDLQDSFIEDARASKLGTLEGYSELRCLSHALLCAAGCSIMDFRTPAELLARPLQQGEVRIFWNGAWYIAGPGDELPRPEIPASLVLKDLPSLCSISDQGPSNTASLNFLMYSGERLMMQVQYDWFHRGWNDVKLSAKKSLGYPWKSILQLVLLFNINYSPFGSSAFFYKNQDVLENFMSTRTRADPTFQSFIPDICRERRQREPESPEEEEQLFKSLAYMSNFQKKGGLVKLMRWMSFFEVAMEWRGDMWGTKLVLQSDQHRNGEDGPGELPKQLQQQQPEQPNAAQDKADAQRELNELKRAQGVWGLAPKMVTQKSVATLDMLLIVTKATWKLHAERARNVVNPQQVLEHNVASSMKMFWAYELEEMVANSLWDKQELRHMYPDTQDNDQLLAHHCDYFHNLLCTRATSLAAAYTLPPMRWNGVLSPCNFEAESMRDNLLKEWQLLLKLEAASLHTKNKVDCLEKMFWRLGTFTRVLCMAHEQDKLRGLPCKDGVAFPHQLLIAKTVGDSRVVEVAHQQGPDLQRGSRNNTVPDVSIMFGTIKSGALELRKVKNTVQVDSQEIIYSNRNLRKVKVASSMNPRGHKLDEGLQRMMRKRQGANWWPSPAPGSLFSSLAATEWCWSYMQNNHIGASVDDSWVSCFAGRPGDLLAHQPSGSLLKIVGAAEYGVLTWQMDASSNTTYFMRPNRMLLQWWHIVDMNDWVHVPAKPFVSDVGAIEWALTGPPMPLVVALAKNALFVNVGQLRRLLKSLGIKIPAGTSKAGMHQLLVDSVLGDPEERKHAMSSFEQASKEEPFDSDLEDVVSCLDEEDANTLDLKELKEKKRKKRYQKKAADQRVPDRNRKGKGKGRGKGRGRGRGRKGRGKGKMAPAEAAGDGEESQHPCQAGPDSAQEATAPSQLPSPAEKEEEETGPSLLQPPEEATAPSQLPGAAEEGEGASLPHPPEEATSPSQLPGAAEEGEGASIPHPPQEATAFSQLPGAAEEGEGASLPHPPQEAAASTQQLPEEAASPVLSPSKNAESADVAEDASQLPAPSGEPPPAEPAHAVKRPKVYKTPQEVFVHMLPPGARMVLNHNDHRFMTSWVGIEKGMPEDLKGKHFSRKFTRKPWKDALAECHMRVWEKWSYVKKHLPLPIGMEPQEPGVVPNEVLEALEPFINNLPPEKKASGKK